MLKLPKITSTKVTKNGFSKNELHFFYSCLGVYNIPESSTPEFTQAFCKCAV